MLNKSLFNLVEWNCVKFTSNIFLFHLRTLACKHGVAVRVLTLNLTHLEKQDYIKLQTLQQSKLKALCPRNKLSKPQELNPH